MSGKLIFTKTIENERKTFLDDLIDAIKRQRVNNVKKLLEYQIDINSRDSDGNTPLLYAVEIGNLEIVNLLLDLQADPNKSCLGNNTNPLQIAAQSGYSEIVKVLLDKGADVNAKNCVDSTALSLAAKNGYTNIVKLLLSYSATDRRAMTISLAVKHDQLDVLKLLLPVFFPKESGSVEMFSEFNKFIRDVVALNKIDALKVIVEYTDINILRDKELGLLIIACNYGHQKMVEYLLKNGVEPDQIWLDEAAYEGKIPLHTSALTMAIGSHKLNVAKILLANGANIKTKDNLGRTPLDYIPKTPDIFEYIELLLNPKNKGSEADDASHYLLTLLSQDQNQFKIKNIKNTDLVKLIEILFAKGADVNKADFFDMTPLMFAIKNKHHIVMSKLLERNANPHQMNKIGETAFAIAIRNGNLHAVKILCVHDVPILPFTCKQTYLSIAVLSNPEGKTRLQKLFQNIMPDTDITLNYAGFANLLGWTEIENYLKEKVKASALVSNQKKEKKETEENEEVSKLQDLANSAVKNTYFRATVTEDKGNKTQLNIEFSVKDETLPNKAKMEKLKNLSQVFASQIQNKANKSIPMKQGKTPSFVLKEKITLLTELLTKNGIIKQTLAKHSAAAANAPATDKKEAEPIKPTEAVADKNEPPLNPVSTETPTPQVEKENGVKERNITKPKKKDKYAPNYFLGNPANTIQKPVQNKIPQNTNKTSSEAGSNTSASKAKDTKATKPEIDFSKQEILTILKNITGRSVDHYFEIQKKSDKKYILFIKSGITSIQQAEIGQPIETLSYFNVLVETVNKAVPGFMYLNTNKKPPAIIVSLLNGKTEEETNIDNLKTQIKETRTDFIENLKKEIHKNDKEEVEDQKIVDRQDIFGLSQREKQNILQHLSELKDIPNPELIKDQSMQAVHFAVYLMNTMRVLLILSGSALCKNLQPNTLYKARSMIRHAYEELSWKDFYNQFHPHLHNILRLLKPEAQSNSTTYAAPPTVDEIINPLNDWVKNITDKLNKKKKAKLKQKKKENKKKEEAKFNLFKPAINDKKNKLAVCDLFIAEAIEGGPCIPVKWKATVHLFYRMYKGSLNPNLNNYDRHIFRLLGHENTKDPTQPFFELAKQLLRESHNERDKQLLLALIEEEKHLKAMKL